MARVHDIYLFDVDDPVTVDSYAPDGIGVRYTDPDNADQQVLVPWLHIAKIVSRKPDPDPDPGPAPADYEPDTEPETGEPDTAAGETDPGGANDSGPSGDSDDTGGGKTDPKASAAKEWPKASNADMRAWAQSQGLAVSASGPVSNDVAEKYAAAHADK